jgi:Transmembrane domain of unknown function (DUF3566)
MPVSRKTQRNGTFGRLTNVTADRGQTSGKQSTDPRVNLNAGDGSEEDGVENRSEPQDWLTDGSEQSADPAQDGKSAAAVKTAVPLLGSGSRAGSPATDRDAAASAVEDTADPIPGITGDPGSWDARPPGSSKSGSSRPGSRNSGGAAANGSYGNRGSGGSDRRGSGGPGSPIGTAAGTAAGVSGASAMSAPYAPSDSSRGGPHTAPFPNPTRSRPQRPGRAPREQTFTGQRAAPAGFPAQGSASSRKAQLAISRIEPWSVMKFSFMISLVGWVILFVAVALMYFVLQKIGVFTSIEHTVGLVTSSKGNSGTNAASWFSASRVLGYTMLIGAVNVILITALATIGAVLYNLVTMLAGGVEVTLKETD